MPDDNYDTIRREAADLHAACMEHVRVRNAQGDRIAALEAMLRRVCGYAATARDENTREWLDGLTERLNEAAVALDEPTQFVLYRQYGGAMWIEAKQIP